MCFTPAVSLITFLIELVLAVWIFSRGPNKSINRVGAIILVFLGIYQLMEFQVCMSGNSLFWAKMAHIAYSVLPALGVHWALCLKDIKIKRYEMAWIYFFPIVWISYILYSTSFLNSAACGAYFLQIVYNWPIGAFWAYGLYYSLFIVGSMILLIYGLIKENNLMKRKMLAWGLLGILSFTLPTLVVMVILPSLNIYFPSVLCHFALLFGIAVTYVISLHEEVVRERKSPKTTRK